MGWQEINKSKYIEQLKKHFNLANSENILEKDKFFDSEEKIEALAVAKYNPREFEEFKEKIKPKLIEICNNFLKK